MNEHAAPSRIAGTNAASDASSWASGGGLILLLVVIAGVVLLFTRETAPDTTATNPFTPEPAAGIS
ncbi:MAG TPA: hypothetical protein VF533_21995 [Solirubrobacteraceae bacterium]|jgi:hypothetical protein